MAARENIIYSLSLPGKPISLIEFAVLYKHHFYPSTYQMSLLFDSEEMQLISSLTDSNVESNYVKLKAGLIETLFERIRTINSSILHCSPDELEKILSELFVKIKSKEQERLIEYLIKNNHLDLAILFTSQLSSEHDFNDQIYSMLAKALEQNARQSEAIDYYRKIKPQEREQYYEVAQARLAVLRGETYSETRIRFGRLINNTNCLFLINDVFETILKEEGESGFVRFVLQENKPKPDVLYYLAQKLYDCDEPIRCGIAFTLCQIVMAELYTRLNPYKMECFSEISVNLLYAKILQRTGTIDSHPALKIMFYKVCIKSISMSESTKLLTEQMQKDLTNGPISALLIQIIKLAKINHEIFLFAGNVFSEHYPLLAYCFYKRTEHSGWQRENLLHQVQPHLKNANLIGAILDECLIESNEQEWHSTITLSLPLLLGERTDLTLSTIIKNAIGSLQPAPLAASSSSGLLFWQPEDHEAVPQTIIDTKVARLL